MWPEITASGKQLDSLKPFVCQPVMTGVLIISLSSHFISFNHNFPSTLSSCLVNIFLSRFLPFSQYPFPALFVYVG